MCLYFNPFFKHVLLLAFSRFNTGRTRLQVVTVVSFFFSFMLLMVGAFCQNSRIQDPIKIIEVYLYLYHFLFPVVIGRCFLCKIQWYIAFHFFCTNKLTVTHGFV